MILRYPLLPVHIPDSIHIGEYSPTQHHEKIRYVFGEAFGESPWPEDWENFTGYDPHGIFIAKDHIQDKMVGFATSFSRGDYGYIGVVAVIPAYRRQGIASALVQRAIEYLRTLDLNVFKIDAYVDSTPAVETYRKLGFEIESMFDNKDNYSL